MSTVTSRPFTFTRDFYVPKNFELLAKDEDLGLEVWGTTSPRIVAIAFAGKRSKPDWHFRFNSTERLQAKIAETISGLRAHEQRVAERRAARNAPHDVKVGDVFRCTWGYDQTNIDFYQCTKVCGAMIEVRQISCMAEETAYLQGDCVPAVGEFIGEPQRKKVSVYNGEPSIRIYDFASARRMTPVAHVAGKALYGASHWTAYA